MYYIQIRASHKCRDNDLYLKLDCFSSVVRVLRSRTHGGKGQFIIGAVRVDAEELGAVSIHSSDDEGRADVPLIPATHKHIQPLSPASSAHRASNSNPAL